MDVVSAFVVLNYILKWFRKSGEIMKTLINLISEPGLVRYSVHHHVHCLIIIYTHTYIRYNIKTTGGRSYIIILLKERKLGNKGTVSPEH